MKVRRRDAHGAPEPPSKKRIVNSAGSISGSGWADPKCPLPSQLLRSNSTKAGRDSPRAWAALSVVLAVLLLAGCIGTASEMSRSMDQAAARGDGGQKPSDPSNPSNPSSEAVDRPTVTLPPTPLKLLPFDVRLRRVADAVGVPVNDKVFDAARGERLALGAHDFANGTVPDATWNSQRMATWMTAMLPVCRDTRVRTYLGDWKKGGVEKFVQGAFGRAYAANDLDDLSAVTALTGDDGWVVTCLSLVSSAEVLLQ
jgi:hypothetical protein